MSISISNKPGTSSAKSSLAQILIPNSPKLLTYKAKIPKHINRSAVLPVLSSQNQSPDLLHQTLSPGLHHLKLDLQENTPSNDNLDTGSGLIRDSTPSKSKGNLAPTLPTSFSGYNLYRQNKQNRSLRVNTSATPLRDLLSCTPSPSSATLHTQGNYSPLPRRPSKFEEKSKIEQAVRPKSKQGDSGILGLTAIDCESPLKKPSRPRLTQLMKPNNFLNALVSPLNMSPTGKVRKSIAIAQERLENNISREETTSPQKSFMVRKPVRHSTLPTSLETSPQGNRTSLNFNKNGRKDELKIPGDHQDRLAVPRRSGGRDSIRQSLLPFLRDPSPVPSDCDDGTPEPSNNTSSVKLKTPENPFSELVEFQNNKMPFHLTWNAETRQRLFTEIKKKASDRGNLDDIWSTRNIEVPQEKVQFLEKKIDKMVEQKKKDIGSRSPVKSALYQFYALDNNTRKKIRNKLQQQLAQEPRFFDL